MIITYLDLLALLTWALIIVAALVALMVSAYRVGVIIGYRRGRQEGERRG